MGGKSYGKTYKTAPAPAKKQPQSSNTLKEGSSSSSSKTASDKQQSAQSGAQQQKSSRWGMLGGALAGLAAGGLLASLFGGGAFSGMQGFDILLLVLLAVGAFFLFRKFKNSANSGAGTGHKKEYEKSSTTSPFSQNYSAKEPLPGSANGANAHFLEESKPEHQGIAVAQSGSGIVGGDDVPQNIPGGFDQQAFLNGAREHYHRLQKAWNENDLSVMREYLAPELYDQLVTERRKLDGQQHTEVLYVEAEIVRADYTSRLAQISVKYTGRFRDQKEGVEEDIHDIWHLERDILQANAPWFIVGIE